MDLVHPLQNLKTKTVRLFDLPDGRLTRCDELGDRHLVFDFTGPPGF